MLVCQMIVYGLVTAMYAFSNKNTVLSLVINQLFIIDNKFHYITNIGILNHVSFL